MNKNSCGNGGGGRGIPAVEARNQGTCVRSGADSGLSEGESGPKSGPNWPDDHGCEIRADGTDPLLLALGLAAVVAFLIMASILAVVLVA